ncbi:ATP-dependent helicase [Neptuniibacter pectenicola]|uniref:ATP-dependent helicase n=1 Tax=Neptuniibacter pectenicola TaxID=1806669 RepID=UPI0030EE1C7B|tara:strand:- start:2061 stop:3695 length:1635 start_codon:yes stop_codon:yes gene_type:complete
MSNYEYTPDQQAAISSNASMVITACPGSGKTTVVAEKIRREVGALPSYQGVIGITFTVKASKELKARCKRDGCDTKSSFFGTIDHFCLSEIIHPFLARILGKKKVPLECTSIKELPQNVKDQLTTILSEPDGTPENDFVHFEEDIKLLFDNGIVLLELLGIVANQVIQISPACQRYIKAKYRSVYIDEYQDSSEAQHALFLQLLDLGLVGVAVGDVQQSIYAWRGSDPSYIQELTRKDDVFEHHIVDINHRCHSSITNYSNRLYDDSCDLIETDHIRVYRRCYEGTQAAVVTGINESIKKAIENNYVCSYSDIGILVRNNSTLEYFANGLDMPFRIFDEDPLAIRNTKTCNLFSHLLRYRFDEHHRLNDVIEYLSTVAPFPTNKLTEVRKLVSSIGEKDDQELASQIIAVTNQFLDVALESSDSNLIREICSESRMLKHYKPVIDSEVQVMTLHKSKGLEFDLVFHVDLYDWIHPKRKFIRGCYDEVFDDWDQELNLHFVGITRAKEHCVLVTSTQRFNSDYQLKNAKASQFLSLPGLDGLYLP